MNQIDTIILCLSLLTMAISSLLLAIFINNFFWIIAFVSVGAVFFLGIALEKQKKDKDEKD